MQATRRRERIGSGRTRSRVAVTRTRPETVLDDVGALMRGLDYGRALSPGRRTILKDNISWHLPYLSANTTPWQLEGVVRTLRQDGYRDLLGLHNQTVVTDAHRGDKLNKFAGVYRRYEVPTVDNFSPGLPLGDDRAEGEAPRPRPHLRPGARARGHDRDERASTCRRSRPTSTRP